MNRENIDKAAKAYAAGVVRDIFDDEKLSSPVVNKMLVEYTVTIARDVSRGIFGWLTQMPLDEAMEELKEYAREQAEEKEDRP